MTTELAKRESTLDMSQWQIMKEQATMLVRTGFLPEGIRTPEQAMAIILTGRELGVGPMTALRKIAVIKGNPTVSPELMLAMCKRHYAGIGKSFAYKIVSESVELGKAHCSFWAKTPETEYTGTFAEADAKAAGLAEKLNWKTYKPAMYRARAISLTLRVVCPDVILGLYTPDEMGALVDADGEIIAAERQKTEPDWDNDGATDAGKAETLDARPGAKATAKQVAEVKELARVVLGNTEEGADGFVAMKAEVAGVQHVNTSDLTKAQIVELIQRLEALKTMQAEPEDVATSS